MTDTRKSDAQLDADHRRRDAWEAHDWIRVSRQGVVIRVLCDVCKVTPMEWLGLQPINPPYFRAEMSNHW